MARDNNNWRGVPELNEEFFDECKRADFARWKNRHLNYPEPPPSMMERLAQGNPLFRNDKTVFFPHVSKMPTIDKRDNPTKPFLPEFEELKIDLKDFSNWTSLGSDDSAKDATTYLIESVHHEMKGRFELLKDAGIPVFIESDEPRFEKFSFSNAIRFDYSVPEQFEYHHFFVFEMFEKALESAGDHARSKVHEFIDNYPV